MFGRKSIAWGGLTLALALVLPCVASADSLTFMLGRNYTEEGQKPEGEPPWLKATFTDTDDGVVLTLSSLLKGDDEFVSKWFFNFAGSKEALEALKFEQIQPASGDQDPEAEVKTKFNKIRGTNGGPFDIAFLFETSNSGKERDDDDDEGGRGRGPRGQEQHGEPSSGRFTSGDSATFLITGNGLMASDFNLAAKGGLYTLAHIQGIDPCNNGSAWITVGNTKGPGTPPAPGSGPPPVPEPATLTLLGVGLAGLARRMRLRA